MHWRIVCNQFNTLKIYITEVYFYEFFARQYEFFYSLYQIRRELLFLIVVSDMWSFQNPANQN